MAVGKKLLLPWLRKPAVFVSCVVTILWLRVALQPNDPVNDPHGDRALIRGICISALHLVLGVGLLVGSVFGNIRPLFTFLVLTAPLAHLAASPLEGPQFWVLLVAPSVAILIVGAYEMMRTPDVTKN